MKYSLRRFCAYLLVSFIGGLIGSLILTCSARAEEVRWEQKPTVEHRVVLHTVSYHFDRSQKWNEKNYGVGYRYQRSDGWSYQTGIYRNSYFRDAVYVIVQREWYLQHGLRVGGFAGFVTGYDVPVAAGLMVSANNLTMRFVPPVGSQTSGVVAFELSKRF